MKVSIEEIKRIVTECVEGKDVTTLFEWILLLKIELEKRKKAHLFVEHIKEHLKRLNRQNVICKICGKTIDEITTSDKGE